VAAFLVYLVGAGVLFGHPLLHDGERDCLCVANTTDAGVYVWAFWWWPHALLHGLNPFYTHLLYAQQGIDLAHGALVPGAALLLSPVTAVAGPLFAFNLAMFLSPVLAAFFAFLLCRRVTGAFWPSLVAGWLFGFSTYMLGQLVGHLNLTLVFLVPAIVHLVLRALSEELGRRTFIVLLALALILQFSFSIEVFASLTLFGAAALVLAYALGDAPARERLRGLLVPMALAYGAALIIVSPYLYYALKPGGVPVLAWRSDRFSNDLLSFVVPDVHTAVAGRSFLSTTAKFTAGNVEGGAYLGVPLLAMVVLAAVAGWRSRAVRRMVAMLLRVANCSLGGRLAIAGPTGVPLPWALVHKLPALGLMLPARFIVYGALIASILAACLLARARLRPVAWILAALAIVSLWPAVGDDFWRSRPAIPTFFRTSAYKQAIKPADTVLVLPVGLAGQSMLWHAEAHLGFTMASGYVTAPEAPDPYKRFAAYPMLTYFAPVPHPVQAAARFLATEHVTLVVLDQASASAGPWVPWLERLGWRPTTFAGVVLLRHTGFVPPPATPQASGPLSDQQAVRALARTYLFALSKRNAGRVCALLTPLARQAVARGADTSLATCMRSLAYLLARAPVPRVRVGSAAVGGTHGYVALRPSTGGPIQYLPVRRLGRRWFVDGQPVR
jgi:hypothetical protein